MFTAYYDEPDLVSQKSIRAMKVCYMIVLHRGGKRYLEIITQMKV